MKTSFNKMCPSLVRTVQKSELKPRGRRRLLGQVLGQLGSCCRFSQLPLWVLLMSAVSLRAAVEWQQDFEVSVSGWSEEGTLNVWKWGTPTATSGSRSAHLGTKCAGTILDTSYPNNVNALLVSPPIDLPVAAEELRLRFWSWHRTSSSGDYGQLQIRTNGGPWVTLTERLERDTGGAWMQRL